MPSIELAFQTAPGSRGRGVNDTLVCLSCSTLYHSDQDGEPIAWGPSTEYGKGDLNSISFSTLDDGRRCVEAHVTSGKLFYRVGVVNTVNKTISWKGPGQEYGTGNFSTIANSTMSKVGYCIEVHNNSGNLFYRTGVYRSASTP